MTSTQTLAVVVAVPDDQQTAAQAAAAGFVADLPSNVDGAIVLSATFGGVSLLPTPQEAVDTALAELQALADSKSPVKPADLAAAAAKVDTAVAQLAASFAAPAPFTPAPFTPASDAAPEVTEDAATVAATTAAPTGEEDAAPVIQDGQPAVPFPAAG